tara:strand:- start:4552 stop:6546 length:1995 start_codon:yes stop_codon:yes gene_type:complete
MRLPICWLKDFVKCNYPIEEIAETFTEIGFECEEILEVEGEKVLDLSVPSNRTDILSIYGLSREFATAKNLKIKNLDLEDISIENKYPIELKSENCKSYLGVHLRISSKEDEHIKKMLKLMGRNSISPLIDLTNYVLFETGQPLHLFPYSSVEKGIVVETANKKVKFNALDGNSYNLSPKDLLIKNKKGESLALAGIIGSEEGSSKDSDKEFLLEAACFKNSSTRQSAERINLLTDSSYRFQRTVDPKGFLIGAKRYLWWLNKLGWTNKVETATLVEGKKERARTITIKTSEINSRLGMDIEDEKIHQILASLGILKISKDKDGKWKETWKIKSKKGLRKGEWLIPSYRTDLSIPEDLIEEVIRVYGYSNLKETLPKIEMSASSSDDFFHIEKSLIDTLVSFGGRQEIRSSLISEELGKLGKSITGNKGLKILNPRSEEKSFLRNSIVASLLRGHENSRKKGFSSGWAFEIGKVFNDTQELLNLGLIAKEEEDGVRLIKNLIEDLALKWNSSVNYSESNTGPFLENSKLSIVSDVFTGSLGAFQIEIGSRKEIVWVCELNLNLYWPMPKLKINDLPKHKFVYRDLNIKTKNSEETKKITSLIKSLKIDIVEEIFLFDVYKKKENWNLTWRLVIGDGQKSYTDEEINKAMEDFKNEIKKNNILLN